MIPWATVHDALKAWFRMGTGLSLVVMSNEPRPFTKPVWGHLQVLTVEAQGWDDTRLVDVPVPDPVTGIPAPHTRRQIQGQRAFTLRVSVESLSQKGASLADNPIERLRATWELEEMMALLAAQNCALADFGPSQMGDLEVDQRVISAWFADVEINTAFTFTGAADVDTIESMTATSSFVEPDGTTPVPAPLQQRP